MLAKEKTWKSIFNTSSDILQNHTEKQTMPFKTTVNWLFYDIWRYLVIGCFDWKIDVFQQTVVRVCYILKAIRLSKGTLHWFRSDLSERIFLVNIESKLSDFGKISCGVPRRSILGPLLFLIYVNNMPQAIKSSLLSYVDDSCMLYQHKEVDEIEKQFNKDFENICEWFVDKELSIHCGEDKTKSILFASKRRSKNVRQLKIRYIHINIKQHSRVVLWINGAKG